MISQIFIVSSDVIDYEVSNREEELIIKAKITRLSYTFGLFISGIISEYSRIKMYPR